MNSLDKPITNETFENENISNTRGRGRGFLLKIMGKHSSEKSANLLSSSILPTENMKSNAVVHNQELVKKSSFQDCEYSYEIPVRSTYNRPEPNGNDKSIYDDGISSEKSGNLLSSSSSILPTENMKSNAVVHNQDLVKKSSFQDCEYSYEIPVRSTYNRPEPNGNDKSIYDDGISSEKSGNLLSSSSSILPTGNVKSNVLVHNQDLVKKSSFPECEYIYEIPARSTYIPPEPNENDISIYDDGISSGINFEKFNDIEVKVNGKNLPEAIESFNMLNNISEQLMDNIKMCNFVKPTPIQKYSIPIILSGKDLMATAQTGSGKTVAYVLPIIQKLLMDPQILVKDKNHSEPQVVIMAPTRELAVQIKMVVLKLTRGTGISSFVCYGGTLVSHQKNQIIKGCHILVATPGRLNEFVQHGFITFSSVRFFVLDEVDKMLDIESKPDIDKILDHFSMPSVMNRQTIMLSATLPDATQHLAKFYLNKNYLFLAVGIISSASKDIKQTFCLVNRFNKREILTNILKKDSVGTIVFVKQKWTADFLATYLCEKHIPSTSIHGDRLQDKREIALNDFRNRKMNVLVATTVAARGLDIKCVNHVINYDMPLQIEEYVQRIGRTGRLGNKGIATSLFDPEEDHLMVDPIITILASANQEIPNWLLKLGREARYNDANDDIDKFGGSDIRIISNSVDECEEW